SCAWSARTIQCSRFTARSRPAGTLSSSNTRRVRRSATRSSRRNDDAAEGLVNGHGGRMSAPGASRIVGIDYLRAVFSVCVVAVHLGYISPSAIFDQEAYPSHTFTWSDFVNFYVLCLAVPVFVLISTYLYALKPTDSAALRRRLVRIVRLL